MGLQTKNTNPGPYNVYTRIATVHDENIELQLHVVAPPSDWPANVDDKQKTDGDV